MDEEQGTITTSSSNADRQSLMNDGNSNGNGNGNDDDDDEVVTTQQQQQQQQQHYDDDEKDENEAASASLLIEKDHHHRRLITINDSDTDTDDHDGDTDDDDDDDEDEENENENDETEGFLLHTSSSLSNNDTTTGNSKMMNKKKKKKKSNNNNNTKTTNNTMLPSSPLFSFLNTNDDEDDNHDSIFYKTLLFDDYKGLYLFGKYPLLDNKNNPNTNGFIIKLLKFIFITYLMIGLIHVIVSQLFEDRDQLLKLKYILLYESDLIVRDCVVFFLVGRLYKKSSTGIDTIMFLSTVLFSNIYFESQNFIYFLQHSVSLYEIHCIWPWELWLFVLLLVPTIGTIVGLHVIKGYRENTLSIKITEMILCLLFFVAPMITSNYFHLHHWYAGWLLGMHCNYNTWWSKMSMAWCWGMYINGIAVYGRDPVLTCEYAYFLTIDNQCPYISCYLDAIQDVNQTDIKEMVPVDWMNCSAASSSGDYMP